jgi:uncharacterized protein (UPF0128 family)
MLNSLNKSICLEVSKELKIPYEQVIDIVESSSLYIKHVMENSGFETVHLPYFGKFKVNPNRLKYYNEGRIKKRSHGVI